MNLTFTTRLCLSLLGILFVPKLLHAQSYIADTIVIPDHKLNTVDSINYQFSVTDVREEGNYFISIFEKKKWLFFPIDQVVTTEKTMTQILEKNAMASSENAYHLKVHNYYIQNTSGFNKTLFNVEASIELWSLNTDRKDTLLLGTFYYEEESKQKKKDSLVNGYAQLINQSNQLLLDDMQAVITGLDTLTRKQNYHFRRGYRVAKKNLYVYADGFVGIDFWGFDIELNFSSPEPAQKFMRKSGMLRFMNFDNRQSVALARNVNYFNYRINNKWLFQNKHALLLGFNRWNDVDEAKRTFEEIFLFQLTATQKITYNPIDKSSLIFGVGVMEDFSYIIYNKPMLNLAIVANIGFKL